MYPSQLLKFINWDFFFYLSFNQLVFMLLQLFFKIALSHTNQICIFSNLLNDLENFLPLLILFSIFIFKAVIYVFQTFLTSLMYWQTPLRLIINLIKRTYLIFDCLTFFHNKLWSDFSILNSVNSFYFVNQSLSVSVFND